MKNTQRFASIFSVTFFVAIVLLLPLNLNMTNAQNNPDDAVVEVLEAVGGTTDPAPGTHYYPVDTPISLNAIPDPGWEFLYWVYSGDWRGSHYPGTSLPDPDTFMTNPVTITCGYGFKYSYQPVFVPSRAAQAPSNVLNYIYPIATVIAIAAAAAVAFVVGRRRRQ